MLTKGTPNIIATHQKITHKIQASLNLTHSLSLDHVGSATPENEPRHQTNRELRYHSNSPKNNSQNEVGPILTDLPNLGCVGPTTSENKPVQTRKELQFHGKSLKHNSQIKVGTILAHPLSLGNIGPATSETD